MNACTKPKTSVAVIIGSSAVAAAAVFAAIAQGAPATAPVAGEMSTGVTVTATNPASEESIPVAVPSITGPAPLPTEEQGLPG